MAESPTFSAELSPNSAAVRAGASFTLRTAMSVCVSYPIISASYSSLLERRTFTFEAFDEICEEYITCAFVTIYPSALIIIPVPVPTASLEVVSPPYPKNGFD